VGNLTRPICSVAGNVQRISSEDKPKDLENGAVHFFGIDQQYFLAVVYPTTTIDGRCSMTGGSSARSVVARFPLTVGPSQEVTQSFGIFIGPKDVEQLAKIGAATAGKEGEGPHLEKTVEFGWFGWMAAISTFLLTILKFFYGLFHNWGVAIICLTIVVKAAMLPLTHKSMMSAEQMKKLQPKMEEVRKKFAQDKERQNLEMIKLYQEAKVNPLGGCLPILIQMPVWIALFGALRNSYEIYGEPFISPIWMDLTYKDPTYILPIALGVTMILTQRLQPQMTMDKTQAMMMTYVMPSVFSLMMLNYPSGLSLYIFTNNLVSIGQQWLLKRYIKHKESVPGPPALRRSR
jgi:YidC/Oxa1 family membrane protein insertase